MNIYNLYWTIGSGETATGSNQEDVTINDTRRIIKKVLDTSGIIELTIKNAPEIGPQQLQLFHDSGRSVIMLGEDDGTEYGVRTYNKSSEKDSEANLTDPKEEILGDLWASSSICTDAKIVDAIFQEFFESGNVST